MIDPQNGMDGFTAWSVIGDPVFVIEYNEDGVNNSGGKVAARVLQKGQVEDIIRKAYSASGDAASGESLIKDLFRDRAGEIRAEKEAAAAKEAATAKEAENKRRWDAEQQRKNEETRANTIKILGEQGGTSASGSKGFQSREEFLSKIASNDDLMDMYRDSGEVVRDAEGNVQLDDQGNEIHRKLTDKEVIDRAGAVYDEIAKTRHDQAAMSVEDRLNYIKTGEYGTPVQTQASKQMAPEQQEQTPANQGANLLEQLKAEKARREAARQAQTQQVQTTTQPTMSTSEQKQVVESVKPKTVSQPSVQSVQNTNPINSSSSNETASYNAFIGDRQLSDVVQDVASQVAAERGIRLTGSPDTWPEDVRQDISLTTQLIYNAAGRGNEVAKDRMFDSWNPRTGQLLFNKGKNSVVERFRRRENDRFEKSPLADMLRQRNLEQREQRDEAIRSRREGLAGRGVTTNYNTHLSPKDEEKFREWRKKLPKNLQSDYDYDLRGYWYVYRDTPLGEPQEDGLVHLTDEFKKPNHPTFSNESRYANGEWAENAEIEGSWNGNEFVPPNVKWSDSRNTIASRLR